MKRIALAWLVLAFTAAFALDPNLAVVAVAFLTVWLGGLLLCEIGGAL